MRLSRSAAARLLAGTVCFGTLVTLTAGMVNADCNAEGTSGNDVIVCDDVQDNGTPSLSTYAEDGNDSITYTNVETEGTIAIEGGAGDDTINVDNSRVTTVNGDDDNDQITITDSVVTESVDGDAGNDQITISANSYVNSVNGGTGNDTIEVAGAVGGIDAGADNDRVTISGDNAAVSGEINGGGGHDQLYFRFSTTSNSEYQAFVNALNSQPAFGGTVTWRDQTFTWTNFEELFALITLIQQAAPSPSESDGVIITMSQRVNRHHPAAPVAVVCTSGVVQIWDIYGGSGQFSFEVTGAQLATNAPITGGRYGTTVQLVDGVIHVNTVNNPYGGPYLFTITPADCGVTMPPPPPATPAPRGVGGRFLAL